MNNLTPRRFLHPEDSFFDQVFNSLYEGRTGRPNVDIKEKKDAFEVCAELPGMDKEDIHISFKNNVLSIAAKQSQEKEEQDDEGNYIRRERFAQSYQRQFIIEGVDDKNINARYENGILTIDLPKRSKESLEEDHRIEIE